VTLYDFGRRAGRYNQAAARKQIADLQLVRADQTVQFDVTAAYLKHPPGSRVCPGAGGCHPSSGGDPEGRTGPLEGGVADPNDVLRAEVQLSKAGMPSSTPRKRSSWPSPS